MKVPFTELDSLIHIQKLKQTYGKNISFDQDGRCIVLVIDPVLLAEAEKSKNFIKVHDIIEKFLSNHNLYHKKQELWIDSIGKYFKRYHFDIKYVKFIRRLIRNDPTFDRNLAFPGDKYDLLQSYCDDPRYPYHVDIALLVALHREKIKLTTLMIEKEEKQPSHVLLGSKLLVSDSRKFCFLTGEFYGGIYSYVSVKIPFDEILITQNIKQNNYKRYFTPFEPDSSLTSFDCCLISSASPHFLFFAKDKLVLVNPPDDKMIGKSFYEVHKLQELKELDQKIASVISKQKDLDLQLDVVNHYQLQAQVPQQLTNPDDIKGSDKEKIVEKLKTEMEAEMQKFNQLIIAKVVKLRDDLKIVLDQLQSLKKQREALITQIDTIKECIEKKQPKTMKEPASAETDSSSSLLLHHVEAGRSLYPALVVAKPNGESLGTARTSSLRKD